MELDDEDYGMNAVGGPEPHCLTCGHLWGAHQGEVGDVPCREKRIGFADGAVFDVLCGCAVFVWPDGLRAH